MAVPDFQSLMRPVLVALDDGQVRPGKDIRQDVRTALGLTDRGGPRAGAQQWSDRVL